MISFDTTSLVKTIIVIGLTATVLLLFANRRRVGPFLQRNERVTTYTTFVLLRLVPFLCVYVVLNQEPRNDVEFLPQSGGRFGANSFTATFCPTTRPCLVT